MASMSKKLFPRSKQTRKKNTDSRDDLEMDHHLYAAYKKGSTGTPSVKTSKSNSLGSITCEPTLAPLEQEDFMSLMVDVRNFSDALSKLKDIFVTDEDEGETTQDVRVAAHDKLGEVLSVLRSVIQKCPALHTVDVLTAAAALISKIKACHYDDPSQDITDLHYHIDQLALSFSISVSEYLMGDVDTYPQLGKTKSYDNLACADSDLGGSDDIDSRDNISFTAEELDGALLKLENGMKVALERAKIWSKYAKDIISYIEKRASLECDFAKGLAKLAASVRPSLTEDSCLPFQTIYCAAIDQDREFATTCQETCLLIQTQEFIEPLNQRRHEHEKSRKALKEIWTREFRKMEEATSNLRKARTLYMTRQQDYEKAKEVAQKAESESLSQSSSGNKADRKRKHEEEAMHRAIDAETTYKACVIEANNRQQDLEKVKGDILAQVRELILQCDQTMKAVTIAYFELQQRLTAPLPVHYQTLSESSLQYELGSQYAEYIRRITLPSAFNNNNPEPFVFEPYVPGTKAFTDRKPSTQSSGSGSSDVQFADDSPEKIRGIQPAKAWAASVAAGGPGSDTDSISGSSCKSRESSPSASPYQQHRTQHLLNSSSMNELAEADRDQVEPRLSPPAVLVSGSEPTLSAFRGVTLSRAAQTHVFKKLRTLSRCRECESYLYFQGAECEKCGLTSHKKCLESLHWECGQKPLQRRMTTFGVDLNQQLQETRTQIPHLVRMCTAEIEQRGLHCKGIYRVSGVKSKVEKLCQSFEIDEGNVDLLENQPNVIANVLKLYLRQLPEPLLTYRLYHDLINLVKDDGQLEGSSEIKVVQRLNSMVSSLPSGNFRTLALLMHHLKRVAEEEEVNQMSSSNLGIVFGPTLMRPSNDAASLNSLMDTPHQTKIVELLITHVEYIFGPEETTAEVVRAQVAAIAADNAEAREKERKREEEREKEKVKDTTVEVLSAGGATGQLTSETPGGGLDEESPDTGTETKWYVPEITESLLDELAREEPRFLQAAEEYINLPGAPDTSTKSEGAEKSLRTDKDVSTSKVELAGSDGGGLDDPRATDSPSDDDLPLPDDSPLTPLITPDPAQPQHPFMTNHLCITGTPALGPVFSDSCIMPVKGKSASSREASPSSLGSSPGLRRKLLMTELINKTSSSLVPSTWSYDNSSQSASTTTTILSQPTPYSPPTHRHLFHVSAINPVSNQPANETTDSEGMTPRERSEWSQQMFGLARSTFYIPSVIVPDGQTIPADSQDRKRTRAQSASPVLQEESREPEFV